MWPFAVRYVVHQLNLWPRVSFLETSPTLRWTGKAGNASVFRVWGSRAFLRDTSTDKLSARAIPCVFLGFPPDAPGVGCTFTFHDILPSVCTSMRVLDLEAITGPYSSQWQAAMDAEMASWKSTGTYVDEVPPPGANIVDGMRIFRVKRPPGSPPAFKARYVARGFSQRQGVDYFQTFSPTPKMTPSSTYSEYIAATKVSNEACRLRSLLADF
ncbi:unnamed protein product [Closterium sp. NIES-53]